MVTLSMAANFSVGDQVALRWLVSLVDKAGENTVTIELQATGQRVTLQVDSSFIDHVDGDRQARRKGPLFDMPD